VFSDQYKSSVTYLSPGTQIGEQNLEKLLYTLYLNCFSRGTGFFLILIELVADLCLFCVLNGKQSFY
jgi:hypothetical protein